MATDRIDARDVLDPNAKTAHGFRARIIARFRRAGANPWDDYVVEPVDGGEVVEVLADVPVQVEASAAHVRMRWHGEVLRLAWLPEAADGVGEAPDADLRARFLARYCRPFAEAAGIGEAAGIARALTTKTPKPSLD
jgi:hypothetical protein